MALTSEAPANLVEMLDAAAQEMPDKAALVLGHLGQGGATDQLTRGELRERVGSLAAALASRGVERGDRVVVLLSPSSELYTTLAAVLKLAATAVVVEPALGLAQLLRCCEATRPVAFIGTGKAHLLRLSSPALRGIRIRMANGRGFPGVEGLAQLFAGADGAGIPTAPADATTPAVISYTSGTGGRPHVVVRTHELLWAQHRALASAFPQRDSDRTLSPLPLFVLHDIAAGTPAVLPVRRRGSVTRVDIEHVVRQVREHGVTILRGAPRFYAEMAAHCEARSLDLPTVRALFVGGAPVPGALLDRLRRLLPAGTVFVVYGSSEAEPIAAIAADEVLAAAPARGSCVGRPVASTRLAVMRIGERSDEPVTPGAVGEIAVAGAHVNVRADATNGWLRTGDAGYLDDHGRLWLVGRVDDRIRRAGRVIFPLDIEPLVDALPFVARSAVIGAPDASLGERTVLIVSPERPGLAARAFGAGQWRRAIAAACGARDLPVDEIRFHRTIPLDRRHASKVRHELLRARYRRSR